MKLAKVVRENSLTRDGLSLKSVPELVDFNSTIGNVIRTPSNIAIVKTN